MAADGADPIRACVFDAYGTLLDIESAMRRAGASLGPHAAPFSRLWRAKQLEQAWVRSLIGDHEDFWACTVAALDYALALYGGDRRLRDALLDAYRTLDVFADAEPALRDLREAGIRTAILSNGSPSMLSDALGGTGLSGLLETCLSIETVRIYKPAPAAYAVAARWFGLAPGSIGFVSSNAWDVAGALRFGFRPVWINRAAAPDEFGLRSLVHMARTLPEAAAYLGGAR